MSAHRHITQQDLRRLAISRQHLDVTSPPTLLNLIRAMGCVQLDPISVVQRSHLLVLWSRWGFFEDAQLNHLLYQEKQLFEYWAHAASIVLTEEYPIYRRQMQRYQLGLGSGDGGWYARWFSSHPEAREVRDYIVERLRETGGCLSRDIEDMAEHHRHDSAWSSGRYVSRILDYLWTSGEIMVIDRQGSQRVWGLTEDHLPAWVAREPWDDEQATRYAVQKAVRALGAATSQQMKRHYTRNQYPTLNHTIKALTHEGVLERVQIVNGDGPLKGEWYIHAEDVPLLERIQAGDWKGRTVLLSPFDNLICDRDRTEQVWNFFFRIEIYVPKHKREYGYYVLPILHDDRLIGRVDPRMDRKTGTLHIQNVYAEDKAPANARTVKAVRRTIEDLARFLDAKQIDWGEVPAQWSALKQ
jgi:uncharacterized protein